MSKTEEEPTKATNHIKKNDDDDPDGALPHTWNNTQSSTTTSSRSSATLQMITGALMVAAWIGSGTFFAGYDWWMPVPFMGYFRQDLAMALLLVQVSLTMRLLVHSNHSRRSAVIMGVLLLAANMVPSMLPARFLPKVYWHDPPTSVREKMIAKKSGPVVPHSNIIHNVQKELVPLLDLIQAPATRAQWTHVSVALGLPYFTLGNNAHFDHALPPQEQETHIDTYSLEFGYKPTPQKQARQSLLRLGFPEVMKETHDYLAENGYPDMVRPLLQRVLKVDDPQKIVLSSDLRDPQAYRLGLPGVTIMYPNMIWDYLVNPHHDWAYKHGLKKLDQHPCPNKRTTEAQTILIPLSTPQGSGLTYWTPEEQEILYKPGDAWTFRSKLLHSIRHWPYREWARGTPRMTLQAFAVQCEDSKEDDKWYVYH